MSTFLDTTITIRNITRLPSRPFDEYTFRYDYYRTDHSSITKVTHMTSCQERNKEEAKLSTKLLNVPERALLSFTYLPKISTLSVVLL